MKSVLLGIVMYRRFYYAVIFLISLPAHSEVLHEEKFVSVSLNQHVHIIPGMQFKAKKANSVDSVFGKVDWPSECSNPVKVSFYGDYWVGPSSSAAQLEGRIFEQIKPLLRWADFNVVNFEGALTREKKRAFESYPFALKQASESLKWLAASGIKYFTLANNHIMDFGWKGAQDTMSAMRKAGMSYAGVGDNLRKAMQPMWLEKNNTRIAVISATTTYPAEAWATEKRPGVFFPNVHALTRTISQANKEADFVVVAFHWGEELNPNLREHQPALAKMALSAGADVVVGHHAHVAQVVDIEPENSMIVYGLGNFVFASSSGKPKFGLGAHFEFCKSDDALGDGSTHSYRMVLTPLQIFNVKTGYRTRAMSLTEFIPFAREYVRKGYFSPELEFFIPGKNPVRTISEWLQPPSQVSKEETIVR